jgi:hypothetical protein
MPASVGLCCCSKPLTSPYPTLPYPCSSPVLYCVSLQDLVKRMLCLDSSKRASIPDILSHRWMRQDNYCGRVSFPLVTPMAPVPSKDCALGLPFSLNPVTQKTAQHPSSAPTGEERLGECVSQSGSIAGAVDDFNADSAVNGRLQNTREDLHRRSSLDLEPAASLALAVPCDTVQWPSYSDLHPVTAIIDNVSDDSADDSSPIGAMRGGNSVTARARPSRSEAPPPHTDPREGPIVSNWPTLETPVSRLSTPAETPRSMSGGGLDAKMINALSAGADILHMDSLDSSRCDSGSSLDSLSFKV